MSRNVNAVIGVLPMEKTLVELFALAAFGKLPREQSGDGPEEQKSAGAGAPATFSDYVELSPLLVSDEMIDAGVLVLSRSDRDYETDASIVREIFLAMAVTTVAKAPPQHRKAKKSKAKKRARKK